MADKLIKLQYEVTQTNYFRWIPFIGKRLDRPNRAVEVSGNNIEQILSSYLKQKKARPQLTVACSNLEKQDYDKLIEVLAQSTTVLPEFAQDQTFAKGLTREHDPEKLRELNLRNQFIQRMFNEHQGKSVEFKPSANISKGQLKAVSQLIASNKYSSIKLLNGQQPTNDILRCWIEAIRTSKKITNVDFNESGLNKELVKEMHRLLDINRARNKIFGKGSMLFARSSMLFGFMGYNFFNGLFTALVVPHAFAASILGGLTIGSLRVASSYLFSRQVQQSKAQDYWQEQSHQEAFEAGTECAKSWAPWFKLQSWTSTASSLGYTMQKAGITHEDSFKPAPKPRA